LRLRRVTDPREKSVFMSGKVPVRIAIIIGAEQGADIERKGAGDGLLIIGEGDWAPSRAVNALLAAVPVQPKG
jgi:hypothetical protein